MGSNLEIKSPAIRMLSQYYRQLMPVAKFLRERLTRQAAIDQVDSLYNKQAELGAHLEKLIVGYDHLPDVPTRPFEVPRCSQSEVLHIAIDTLLRRVKRGTRNVLCLGYSRGHDRNTSSFFGSLGASVVNDFPNSQIGTLSTGLWQELLQIIGEGLMLELLCETSVYVCLPNDCYYQLTGDCLGDISIRPISKRRLAVESGEAEAFKRRRYGKETLRSNDQITIVRSRLFYSRPTLNSKGEVTFGLRHIHVLNRFSKMNGDRRVSLLMMNIFPLQFNLHNVFSSQVDRRETVQPFKDYTVRDDVLESKKRRPKCLNNTLCRPLIELHSRHRRCAYGKLLDHYCPIIQSGESGETLTYDESTSEDKTIHTQACNANDSNSYGSTINRRVLSGRKEIFTNFASSPVSVAAFVSACLHSVLHPDLLGRDNIEKLAEHLSRWIQLRRYESLTLGQFLTGISLRNTPWLVNSHRKLSLSETRKKQELLAELVYWIVDSFVVPLLRSHFYVTETHLFRNRVMYFRHDVWKRLCEPELSRLRLTMLSEVPIDQATETLRSRTLGFAYMRLLPKGTGARPITNLRRRTLTKDGTKRTMARHLLPSINSVVQCVYNVLSYESRACDSLTGFAIQSVNDIHSRLKDYRRTLSSAKHTGKLYFAKVDVKNCFDSIDQEKVLSIVADLLSQDDYMLQKFCALAPSLGKIARKYHNIAIPAQDMENFGDFASEYLQKKQHTVLVDGVTHQFKEKLHIFELLEEHLNMHLIKVGKKFYKQDTGIPQGSVLSSILCNLYYGDMETRALAFLKRQDTLCLRLIDDFLVITADRHSAEEFLQVMHEGNPEYGCFVAADKSLVNFEAVVCGERIATLAGSSEFPYCGATINTMTLEARKDFSRTPSLSAGDTLTVDYAHNPGSSLMPKIFQGLKLSCQALYIDTSFNSLHTVLLNIYRSLTFAAMRYHAFLRCIRQNGSRLAAQSFEFVDELTGLLFVFLKSRNKSYNDVECCVTRGQVSWLGMHAFQNVLRKRPAEYDCALPRMRFALDNSPMRPCDRKILHKVVRPVNVECFSSYEY